MTETLRLKASRVYVVRALVGDIWMYVENMSLVQTVWTPDRDNAIPLSSNASRGLVDRLHAVGINADAFCRE